MQAEPVTETIVILDLSANVEITWWSNDAVERLEASCSPRCLRLVRWIPPAESPGRSGPGSYMPLRTTPEILFPTHSLLFSFEPIPYFRINCRIAKL
jgi:hypothetical protein